jgi:hypothetical protein
MAKKTTKASSKKTKLTGATNAFNGAAAMNMPVEPENADLDLTITANDSRDYAAIIKAHHLTKQALCLWGSSGYGKTSTVRAAAEELGYKLVDMRLSYRDPLSLFLPIVNDGVIEYVFSDVIKFMFEATEPTIVFLDEITNPSSPEIYNVLKELLNERTILGKRVSDQIVFVAASNWASEDIGVKELPDSLMRRMTHIAFSPDKMAIVSKLQPMAQKFFSGATAHKLLPGGHIEDFNLTACPRQVDACERLAVDGGLRGSALRQVFIGRIGPAAGIAFADHIEQELSQTKRDGTGMTDGAKLLASLPVHMSRFPIQLFKDSGEATTVKDEEEYKTAITAGYRGPANTAEDKGAFTTSLPPAGGVTDTLVKLQNMGMVTEVVGYLLNHGEIITKTKRKDLTPELREHKAAVAAFLGMHANAEIVRMVFDQKNYNGYFVELEDLQAVNHPATQPIIWCLPAYSRYALQVGDLP